MVFPVSEAHAPVERPHAGALGATLVVAARLVLVLTIVTGVAYPLVVTGVAALAFPREASGSLIVERGVVRGSQLIGQEWTGPRYFLGRPSATSPKPCDGAASAGSNLGPQNPALTERTQARIAALAALDRAAGVTPVSALPIDLVTASASGLDPHISPAAAEVQVARVARTRGLAETRVRALIRAHTAPRALGVLGEPTVDVLSLNLALDQEPSPQSGARAVRDLIVPGFRALDMRTVRLDEWIAAGAPTDHPPSRPVVP